MRLLTTGIEKIDTEKFLGMDVFEYKFCGMTDSRNKPETCGLYSSPLNPSCKLDRKFCLNDEVFPSPWFDFAYFSGLRTNLLKYGISYELKPNTKILVIDSKKDYQRVLEKYSQPFTDLNIRQLKILAIDFLKVSQDYDCIRITENAILKSNIFLDTIEEINGYTKALNFKAYDCDTVLLLNIDCINMDSIWNHVFDFE